MSKEIAQTVGGKRIAWLIAIVAAFAVFATLATQWRLSAAAEPAPVLSYSKSAAVDGHYIEWTLAVSNAGDADSDSQTVQDTLPAGADWAIVEDTIGCELGPSALANRLKLSCDKFIVPARNLDGVDTDGLRFVTIGGIVDECGVYSNAAQFNFLTIRSTTVSIACPATPTPVPSATATPPPTVTSGPVELPTATPTKPAAVPSNVPKPPNTGDSPIKVEVVSHRNEHQKEFLFFLAFCFCLVGLMVLYETRRRSR